MLRKKIGRDLKDFRANYSNTMKPSIRLNGYQGSTNDATKLAMAGT